MALLRGNGITYITQGGYVTSPDTTPVITAIQILSNSDFSIPHGEQNFWTSPTGWGGNANPVISGGVLRFTYTNRTVSQSVVIQDYSNYSNATLSFAVNRNVNKTDAQNTYHIQVNFRDSGNNVVGTYRYPETGSANTNGTDWYYLSFDFVPPQGNVVSIDVNVTGKEVNWAGQYGPGFNYVELTLF